MMTTKYVIEMIHNRCIGNDITYYYKGESKDGCSCYDHRKNLAKRYTFEHEAIRDMQILKAKHSQINTADTFNVSAVRCKV